MKTIARTSGLILLAALACSGCATAQARIERERDARQAQSHFDLGVDHLANGRTALAIRELLAAESMQPRNPRTQYALGDAYMRAGKLDKGEQHLKRALEVAPDYHDARLHLAALYIHTERYEAAVEQSKILVDDATFPAPWRALTNLGWAYFKLGKMEEARKQLELANRYNRSYWPALLDLGILENQEGRKVEAVNRFKQVLELRPGPSAQAEANYRLAEIYVSLGKRDRAVGHLTAAVTQTPDGQWGKKSEEYLKLLR